MAITFGVVIPTYYANQETFQRACATLGTLRDQTYPHWQLYLIGDRYEPAEAFTQLAELLPREKVVALNLPRAVERETSSGLALWCTGGRMANNIALTMQQRDGIRYTCHLDHDDLWQPDHLATLADAYAQFPGAAFVYTRALYRAPTCNFHLPRENAKPGYNNLLPRIGNIVHAAVSWRLDWIPLRYRAHPEEPADAYMWSLILEWCRRKGLPVVHVPKVTVIKESRKQDRLVYQWRKEAKEAKVRAALL